MTSVLICGSSSSNVSSIDAVLLGALLAEMHIRVITGGYGGIMEAVSKGAYDAGGDVVGVTVPGLFPDHAVAANPYVTEEIQFRTYEEREAKMFELADATIILEGQMGTSNEFTNAWLMTGINGKLHKPLIALRKPWENIADFLVAQTGDTRNKYVHFVDTIDEILAIIKATVHRGSVTMYLGPMYAGKTTALLNAHEKLRSSIIFRPKMYETVESGFTSHDGRPASCTYLERLSDGWSMLGKNHTILINEAQFFSDLPEFVDDAVKMGYRVVLYGFTGSALGTHLGRVNELIPRADHVIFHRSKCSVCGREAPFTAYVENESKLAEMIKNVGHQLGDHHYSPRCRKHWKNDL
jgi:uncharacterized protein (TIGR00725 family)